jgi:hypothetical protein
LLWLPCEFDPWPAVGVDTGGVEGTGSVVGDGDVGATVGAVVGVDTGGEEVEGTGSVAGVVTGWKELEGTGTVAGVVAGGGEVGVTGAVVGVVAGGEDAAGASAVDDAGGTSPLEALAEGAGRLVELLPAGATLTGN